MIKVELKDEKITFPFGEWIIFSLILLTPFLDSIYMNYHFFMMDKNGYEGVVLEEVIINNKKTILAEVILVDNLHNPKKLICQEKRADGTVIQYKKEKKWGNFKEKPGEYVAVDVNEKNERQYEIFER